MNKTPKIKRVPRPTPFKSAEKPEKMVLERDWKSWPVTAAPTQTTAQVRQDPDGNHWQWISSGKRTGVKKVTSFDEPENNR